MSEAKRSGANDTPRCEKVREVNVTYTPIWVTAAKAANHSWQVVKLSHQFLGSNGNIKITAEHDRAELQFSH